MTKANLLEKVKSMLGITGTYQDAAIQSYIDEVKQYLIDGGVQQKTVDAPTSTGIIARGVSDLWNYGAGEGRLSAYFKERAIQLSKRKVDWYSVHATMIPRLTTALRDGKNVTIFHVCMNGDVSQVSDIFVNLVPKLRDDRFTKKDLENFVMGGTVGGKKVVSMKITNFMPYTPPDLTFNAVISNISDELASKFCYYARLQYVINGELTYCPYIAWANLSNASIIYDYDLPDE